MDQGTAWDRETRRKMGGEGLHEKRRSRDGNGGADVGISTEVKMAGTTGLDAGRAGRGSTYDSFQAPG